MCYIYIRTIAPCKITLTHEACPFAWRNMVSIKLRLNILFMVSLFLTKSYSFFCLKRLV